MTEYGISNPLLATDVVLSRPNACLNVSCCVQNQIRSSPGMYLLVRLLSKVSCFMCQRSKFGTHNQ